MSLPAKNSFANLGGDLVDYSPATDPTTDLPASCDDETRSDVADMTRTAIRAWFSLQVISAVCSIPNSGYDATYGNAGPYKPVATYVSPGIYTVVLPASIVDNLGVTRYINLQAGWANYSSTDNTYGYYDTKVRITGPNTLTVYLWDPQGPTNTDPVAGTAATTYINVFLL